MSAGLRALYQFPYDSWKNRIATLRFVQDIPLSPGDRAYDLVSSVSEGIGQFRNLPMLICWGELDFVFDKSFLAEWRQRFPEAEVHSYPDCGHYILEDARDEVVPLISGFLDRTEG
jgi:haloalkane dehalogenase